MSPLSQPLILASSSPFRQNLLERLGVPFSCHSPDIDEQPHHGEAPDELVQRLALHKAEAVARHHPDALIIGSDQVAVTEEGTILGKPGNREAAIAQLMASSGRSVSFRTGLCLLNARSGQHQVLCEPFTVYFRPLSRAQIARYVDREQPFQCAGSFKSEGFGITLFTELAGRDPNTLVGLPLIALTDMLAKEGIALP